MALKVLLVEDDEILVFIHEKMVKKSEISSDPLCFFNGKEALDYLLKHKGEDNQYLIFLDINMPIMDGWELMDNLSSNNLTDRTNVVMVTSSTSHKDKERAMAYNTIIDFIEKPLNIERCNRIKNLTQISTYFSQ